MEGKFDVLDPEEPRQAKPVVTGVEDSGGTEAQERKRRGVQQLRAGDVRVALPATRVRTARLGTEVDLGPGGTGSVEFEEPSKSVKFPRTSAIIARRAEKPIALRTGSMM